MTRINKHLLLVLLISLTVSSTLFIASTSAKTDKSPVATIYISPSRSSYPKLNVGDEFKVYVMIDSVNNLYAYEFKLKYDPEILDFVGIESSFLNTPIFAAKKIADETSGTIWYALTSTYPAASRTGSGTLATITFIVKNREKSNLDIYDSKLLDSNVNRIEHFVIDYSGKSLVQGYDVSAQPTIQSSIVASDITPLGSGGCVSSAEVCDRIDNDCDGHVDEPDVCLSGDVDHLIEYNNYTVGLEDLTNIGATYGSTSGTARYDSCNSGKFCDLNEDGIVNIFDLAKVGKNYGNTNLAGCVDVTVQFYNSDKISGADVSVVDGPFIGTTNSSGQVRRCSLLNPGNYQIKAIYGGEQYGKNTDLIVNTDGSGSNVIDGRGCTTILTKDNEGNRISGLEIWIMSCAGTIDVTNSVGVAQYCGEMSAGGYYTDAFYTSPFSCFGGNVIDIYNNTGFTIIQPSSCSCSPV